MKVSLILAFSVGVVLSNSFLPFGEALVAARTETFPTSAGTVSITPLHLGSVRIEAGGKVIYLDPVKPFDFEKTAKADLILITDTDEEHMDPAAIKVLSKPGTEIIAPLAASRTLAAAWPMNHLESKTWHGWTIEAVANYAVPVPAPPHVHHEAREKGHANGYLLTYGEKRFYFSGASEDGPEIRALKDIDVAFVPVRPHWRLGAAFSARLFRPKIVIPYDYDESQLAGLQQNLDGTGIEIRASGRESK